MSGMWYMDEWVVTCVSGMFLCFSMQNSFFSMYLLNSFSSVVDTAVKFAEIAGYTHRYGGERENSGIISEHSPAAGVVPTSI